ncbi:hypothetical protein DFR50_107111 [Roseiarcus fermentans]|uniref:Uncharacterized protein n=1 Tax=Roseiarcus fermentans TaxID=1473586 RepID=A0A366FMN9_9HYPH|nr:hypothetical protein [Roseiarcus fermentans]RBP15841.1 hypothetical protein DFR50_107111 [Roseiarcus fermentans]
MAILALLRSAFAVPLAIALLVAVSVDSMARETSTFVIAAAQGYGVEDCLAEGGECGRDVAEAWCQAKGRGEAVSFGRSAGVDGAGDRPYFITCGE